MLKKWFFIIFFFIFLDHGFAEDAAIHSLNMIGLKVLVIGKGGREHAIAWKLSLSPHVEQIFVAPGSDGIDSEDKVCSIKINTTDINELVSFAQDHKIDFTIVGPEQSLELGIVDAFEKEGLLCLGPTANCALLETSKAFAKDFMKKYDIPHAKFQIFTEYEKAKAYLETQKMPVVIKADGLANGKGVVIVQTKEEGLQVCYQMLEEEKFSSAGKKIIIEEFLKGEELSFILLTDGETSVPLVEAQDHKPLNDGDEGPNTGGMGTYSPVSILTQNLSDEILENIIQPTLQGIAQEQGSYSGFLYVGLMITPNEGPKVLEYNCRLGDPEAQVILMRLQSDFALLCKDAMEKNLKN